MLSRQGIKAILIADVERARDRYRRTVTEFRPSTETLPSRQPDLDTLFPLACLDGEKSAAVKALCNAVQRYDDFVLRGKVPNDLIQATEERRR